VFKTLTGKIISYRILIKRKKTKQVHPDVPSRMAMISEE